MTNADFVLQDGTTLPLKFKLYNQDGTPIPDMQNIYLTVDTMDEPPVEVSRWDLGDSIGSLRFDDAEYYYIANFQTRNYDLTDGVTYNAVVHDGCTGEILGSISFILDIAKGAGRGNSGK